MYLMRCLFVCLWFCVCSSGSYDQRLLTERSVMTWFNVSDTNSPMQLDAVYAEFSVCYVHSLTTGIV